MTAIDHRPNTLLPLLTEAIDRACGWVIGRIGDDGDPGARHCHYYRVPWALALAGRRAEASAVLSWVEREALDKNGDLAAGEPRTGFESRWASYPLAILASSAWHLERYDTALRLARRLRAYQHPATGGAFASHPEHRIDERQDLFPTAQLGMTGLTTGLRDLADGAFHWMRLLYDQQPDLPTRLFSATDGADLITDITDDTMAWQVVTDFTQPRQAFYNPGIAAAFLGRYHMATGDVDALDLARKYLDLTVGGTEAQFDHTDSVQVCKFGWGSAVLLEATGEQQYLEHVLRMGQWFLDAQNDNGTWDNSPFLMARGGHADSIRVEVTVEFVQHLVSLATALGGWQHNRKGDLAPLR
jgi:hypothetical protein